VDLLLESEWDPKIQAAGEAEADADADDVFQNHHRRDSTTRSYIVIDIMPITISLISITTS